MGGYSDSQPQLLVVSRGMAGVRFDIPGGHTEIGGMHGSGIRLEVDGVSRRHASLDRTGDQVVINDLGSTNGTWVNGHKIVSGQVLRDGDRLRIGYAELRFVQGAAAAPPASYGFGDVRGPVNAGSGVQYVGGYHQSAGRDIYGDNYDIQVNADYEPIDEVFQGRGFGRVLLILGMMIALAGFGIWGSFIFGFVTTNDFSNPFEKELVPGIPMAPTGFGLFVAGGVLAGIGSSMSKAARKRAQERNRRRRGPRR
ncbi:FHA domain-containing protein [Nonomuraea turcica]|uniref:FHA domain-containing protein n=1 Tax=Nonomuraea sp. G32 TaxID=3067274 RepID=UPI00273C10B7|nr:FHA domain-containing protein [Nonomuraea sp. G32]MDP4500979.1 FHA domain-containing protein [Nonomuraea sp. G32]